MPLRSRATPASWHLFRALPKSIQVAPVKQHALLERSPRHPSLMLKKVKNLWSVRVTEDYRAVAFEEDGTLVWFWIGTHTGYNKRIRC